MRFSVFGLQGYGTGGSFLLVPAELDLVEDLVLLRLGGLRRFPVLPLGSGLGFLLLLESFHSGKRCPH